MPAYQQMGHHSENLLFDPGLSAFAGAVLSPVNYTEEETRLQVEKCGHELANFDLVFDPQLYYPNTERGVLERWSYFPSDVETADLSSTEWWDRLIAEVAETAKRLKVNAVCSPVVVPGLFSDEFFSLSVDISNRLLAKMKPLGVRVLQSGLVHLPSLADAAHPPRIASILSATATDELFLVVAGGTEPRRELDQTEELKGLMRLISALSTSGIRVLVGFSSSDIILWKAAGADSCTSGKFFNLRRFTASRFEEPSGGGGQLPYWFEESLLGFLRESDLIRVRAEKLLSEASVANPFGRQILESLDHSPGSPWLRLAWRQFLYWFADIEFKLSQSLADSKALTREAEGNWQLLQEADVLMEEPRNDGRWLRPWRRALIEFNRPQDVL